MLLPGTTLHGRMQVRGQLQELALRYFMTVIAPKSNEERKLNAGPCCLEDAQLVAATRRENAERRARKGKGHAATDIDKSGINYCMLTHGHVTRRRQVVCTEFLALSHHSA